jgi:hypothetical protein
MCRPEGGEAEADTWSQQSSEDLYNLNTLNGHISDPGFSPKPVKNSDPNKFPSYDVTTMWYLQCTITITMYYRQSVFDIISLLWFIMCCPSLFTFHSILSSLTLSL